MPIGFLAAGVGSGEVLVILAVILIVFGPTRLPEIARTLGKWMHQARSAADMFRDEILRLDQPLASPPPSSEANDERVSMAGEHTEQDDQA